MLKPLLAAACLCAAAIAEAERPGLSGQEISELVAGATIEIDTPLGQSIPATLTIERAGAGYSAVIHSEMGDADLGSVEINNNSFNKTASLEMDGHAVEAQVFAKFEGEQVEGTLQLQNSPDLPFTGTKN